MKINNLEKFREKIASGKIALGGLVTFTDPSVTELAAEAGFDFVFIDGEHGVMDRNTAMLHLMAVRGTDCASFYRVPACDHTEIKRVIDFGPAGIIVPMIMNADDARLAVEAMRYPTEGTRGCGFRRCVGYGSRTIDEYWEEAKKEPLVILQIEHIEAVRNIDSILAVEGIDAILVGPYDLSTSMGKSRQWYDPEVAGAYDLVARKVKERGLLLGASCDSEYAAWKKRGVDFIAIRGDYSALYEGFTRAIVNFENA